MTFSENQVRQMYIALSSNVSTATGYLAVSGDNGSNAAKSDMFFKYNGAGGVTRSDVVPVKQILKASFTPASKMVTPITCKVVTLDNAVNSGNVIAGQDYILRLAIRQYIGMSDTDQYFKEGMVHGYTGMTTAQFMNTLYDSLVMNFKRELVPLFDFKKVNKVDMTTNTGVSAFAYTLSTSTCTIQFATAASEGVAESSGAYTISLTSSAKKLSDAKRVLAASAYADKIALMGDDTITLQAESSARSLAGSDANAIAIVEAPQEWRLGVKEQVPVYFEVQPTTVTFSGNEVIWGKVANATPCGTIKNGKKTADMEYFFMGERGDIYRNVGFPHNIPTKYLVDPAKEYDMIDIHYYYAGDNEAVQKSEKTITIACPVDADGTHTIANTLVGDINIVATLTLSTIV